LDNLSVAGQVMTLKADGLTCKSSSVTSIQCPTLAEFEAPPRTATEAKTGTSFQDGGAGICLTVQIESDSHSRDLYCEPELCER